MYKFAYFALPLFYSLLRLPHQRNLTVVILDMFISAQIYSFRFVSQNTVSREIIVKIYFKFWKAS